VVTAKQATAWPETLNIFSPRLTGGLAGDAERSMAISDAGLTHAPNPFPAREGRGKADG